MKILFFDLEFNPNKQIIEEIGAVMDKELLRCNTPNKLIPFLQKATILCGHNIIKHDLPLLAQSGISPALLRQCPTADTLLLSVLLFTEKPYHHLVKDYQLQNDTLNDPIADSLLAQKLLHDCVQVFLRKPIGEQRLFLTLLGTQSGFDGFFQIATPALQPYSYSELLDHLTTYWSDRLCIYALQHWDKWEDLPIPLSFALALAQTNNPHSILPPWLLANFPQVEIILKELRAHPCHHAKCAYCQKNLSPQEALQQYFGYPSFRQFEYDRGKPLQLQVVEAGLRDESFLAIFPTGGGKSLTFQLPALMLGRAQRGLTVVISPLQALMKDQVDVLENRFNITEAVAINGLLSPLERSHAIKRISEGGAHILYLSPESLRSTAIFNMLKRRSIVRFVIDEAHCFSAWGQDFRTDYLYIASFIQRLTDTKKLSRTIPVSCFTATAKPQVIEEIKDYFLKRLNLPISTFVASATRKNLHYHIIKVNREQEKYQQLLTLVQQNGGEPSIVYVSRTSKAEELANRLRADNAPAVCYHGKLHSEQKNSAQEAFISGEVNIVVATAAFGMGVDKDNVKNVIHYEVSSSLENYVQEAGRAGRNEHLQANCYVLYQAQDLSKHFQLHRLSKLGFKDIHQIWRGIKLLTQQQQTISKSATEIAKAAGWDIERDVETRVKSALALLEEQGYLKRGFNRPKVFADSISVNSVEEGRKRIEESGLFTQKQALENAIRVFLTLFKKSRQDGELDHVADVLGLPRDQVITTVRMLKQAQVIGDSKDLSAYIDKSQGIKNSKRIFRNYQELAIAFCEYLLQLEEKMLYLKKANHDLHEEGVNFSNLERLKQLMRYWKKQGFVSFEALKLAPNTFTFQIKKEDFSNHVKVQFNLAQKQLSILNQYEPKAQFENKFLVEFSLLEIQSKTQALYPTVASSKAFEERRNRWDIKDKNSNTSIARTGTPTTYRHETALLLLHYIGAIELKDGFLVFYTPLDIERLETNNRIQFKKQDYEKLEQFYQHKVEQIHIVGEYAKKMIESYQSALSFVNDYFTLPYGSFLKRHFPGAKRKDIQRPMTEAQFKKLVANLSPMQLEIVKSQEPHSLVIAGPGSGKTRVLVQKIASILQIEDIRPEQFLMLTFSRAAAYEFKQRLHELIGSQSYMVDIYTFHGYAFELLGKLGNLDSTDTVIPLAIEAIKKGEAPPHKIYAKSMVVVDEFQDIGVEEFRLLQTILTEAEEVRSVVVGDDDQNIYEFRGAEIQRFNDYRDQLQPTSYELLTNYRSCSNIVQLSDLFIRRLTYRLKSQPLIAHHTALGEIHITEYTRSNRLFVPLLNLLKEPSTNKESIAVLTTKNKEIVILESLLNAHYIPTQLFLNDKDFRIRDLREMRFFSSLLSQGIERQEQKSFIEPNTWNSAKVQFLEQSENQSHTPLIHKSIELFEKQFTHAPISEWKTYLRELRAEDLRLEEQGKVFLSTLHKAKGREFDEVHILLQDYPVVSDAQVRNLYVAITRAKKRLHIHTNHSTFRQYSHQVEGLSYWENEEEYQYPAEITIACSLRDIALYYCDMPRVKEAIHALGYGDLLFIDQMEEGLMNAQELPVLRFSKAFLESYRQWIAHGYRFYRAQPKYFLYWFDQKKEKEVLVPIVHIFMKRGTEKH